MDGATGQTTGGVLDSVEEWALDVRGLGKRYLLRQRFDSKVGATPPESKNADAQSHWALRGATFKVASGERVGVIGRNGSGKSTLLKLLSRVIAPTAGRAEIRGRVSSLLEVGTGFNPNLTGRENVFLNASLHGLAKRDVEARLDQIAAFAEIGKFFDEPVKTYSTGMRSRLGFAVAAHLDPDILMLDEVLSVGDAAFQAKCLQRMGDLTDSDRTLLFVSHSIAAVRRFCDRAIWLESGQILMDGQVIEVTEAYENKMLQVQGQFRSSQAPAKPAAPSPATPAGPKLLVEADSSVAMTISGAILGPGGHQTNSVRIDQPLFVEIVFDVLQPNCRVEPAFHLFDDRGDCVFVAAFTDPDNPTGIDNVGRYRALARVQGNLLNEGIHRITLCLSTADPMVRHEVLEKALSFSVYETSDLLGPLVARGQYARRFPGAVRPRLDWSLNAVL